MNTSTQMTAVCITEPLFGKVTASVNTLDFDFAGAFKIPPVRLKFSIQL